jgi:hypothetical protein
LIIIFIEKTDRAGPIGQERFPGKTSQKIIWGDLTPIWRYFGADEANYAYMKDGKKLIVRTRPTWRPAGLFSAAIICSRAATARMR